MADDRLGERVERIDALTRQLIEEQDAKNRPSKMGAIMIALMIECAHGVELTGEADDALDG